MADTSNTRFTNCLYCKIIVVTDVVFKYFSEYGIRKLDFLCIILYQPGSDVLIYMYMVPSSVLRFYYDKIGMLPLVTLCSLYVPKLLNFIDAFNCYKQK